MSCITESEKVISSILLGLLYLELPMQEKGYEEEWGAGTSVFSMCSYVWKY